MRPYYMVRDREDHRHIGRPVQPICTAVDTLDTGGTTPTITWTRRAGLTVRMIGGKTG
jgi:hypothetical protein